MPSTVIQYIKDAGLEYTEYTELNDVIPHSDIIYMTRVQRERFPDPLEYEKVKNSYILRNEMLENSKPNCRILHPLPRVNEIAVEVDDDPRACYFKQVLNGKLMRMALIMKLLDEAAKDPSPVCDEQPAVAFDGCHCKNPRCITTTEQELPHLFKLTDAAQETYRCIYCESKLIR